MRRVGQHQLERAGTPSWYRRASRVRRGELVSGVVRCA
jgi:hypothetical protein